MVIRQIKLSVHYKSDHRYYCQNDSKTFYRNVGELFLCRVLVSSTRIDYCMYIIETQGYRAPRI